jgi:hypothetical protein
MRVIVSDNVVLPQNENPIPATIELETGKIIRIYNEKKPRDHYPQLNDDDWIQVNPQLVILPGIVE